MTETPHIPIPLPRRPVSAPSLTQTPPPTVQYGGLPLPCPFGSLGHASSGSHSDSDPGLGMPDVGDEVQGFRLVEELGRGTFGRVFLAHQLALASRPVALKATMRPTREPERLARLQHLNVVPVYSVHAAGPVQLICMPLRGRRTLADVLNAHRASTGSASGWHKKTRAQRGSTTVTNRPKPPKPATPKPTAPTPEQPDDIVGDPAVVLPLIAQLAAGLDHAHGRGILHLDIKPGNVLLADTGEAMLLDFNLSSDATEPDRELVGGTVPYMAPEQLLDLKSRGRGGVDVRTDLYALGVVAFELLTGHPPFPATSRALADYNGLMAVRQAGAPTLRGRNPAVTPAVEAIVRKLLDPAPESRYQTAADLKDDLDRQLADQPLRFARDRSVAERVRKWRRRNPRLLAASLLAAVVLAAGGSTAYGVHAADGRSDAEARLKAQATADQLHPIRLDLTVPDEPVSRARGVSRARTLLADYGLPDDPNWRDRETFRRLPPDTRAALAADLGEVAVLLATAVDSSGEAERLTRSAAGCFPEGAPPALARLAREFGIAAATPPAPAAPRDYFLDAAEAVRAGRFTDAVAALEEVTFADPTHAAAQYLLGASRDRLGQSERAVELFAMAAALLPRDMRTYREWGRAELNAKRPDRAEKVYSLSLKRLDGTEPGADFRYLRGAARLQLRDYMGATDDFTTSLRCGVRPVASLLGRAAVRDATGDAAGATADRRALADLAPTAAVEWLARAREAEAHDPAAARHDFEQAVAGGPMNADTHRGLLSFLLARPAEAEPALRAADAAVARFPAWAEFHAARALALARLGHAEEARQAVAAADARQPTGMDSFRIAAALAHSSPAADRAEALCWLKRAYLAGVREPSRYDGCADFDGLRETAEFREYRAAVGVLVRK